MSRTRGGVVQRPRPRAAGARQDLVPRHLRGGRHEGVSHSFRGGFHAMFCFTRRDACARDGQSSGSSPCSRRKLSRERGCALKGVALGGVCFDEVVSMRMYSCYIDARRWKVSVETRLVPTLAFGVFGRGATYVCTPPQM